MTNAARKTDKVKIESCSPGLCPGCSHGPQIGTIMTPCATSTKIEGLKAARITDQGPIACPHGGTFKIVKTCTQTFIDGKLAARLNDKVVCLKCGSPGMIIKSPLAQNTHVIK